MGAYVALLRGINVGGKSLITMADLKACFEQGGFSHVQTYINSGNVLFRSNITDLSALTDKVDAMLVTAFPPGPPVVVLAQKHLQDIVGQAPKDFGSQPTSYRYDVIFVKPPLTTAQALPYVVTRQGVDRAAAGQHALYFSRLISRATQSRLNRLIASPIYKNLTIRNWNTTTKLLALLSNM